VSLSNWSSLSPDCGINWNSMGFNWIHGNWVNATSNRLLHKLNWICERSKSDVKRISRYRCPLKRKTIGKYCENSHPLCMSS
jgi:hypothetical protein